MKTKQFVWLVALAIALVILTLGACSQSTQFTQNTPVEQAITVKIAVLPILDTLPLYVAQQENLFTQRNLMIEFIPVGSAPERDQLIVAGQADGMVNEILSTMFLNQSEIQVQTVRFARVASAETPLFSILVSSDSDIETPADLAGVEIGISQGTVIEYLTERLLQAEGLEQTEIRVVAVPKISDRMALLASGELKAAMLPDPLTFLAAQQGARFILDDTILPENSFSVLTFRKEFIDQNPEAMRAFLDAVEEAVNLINAQPDKYASLLSDKQLVPAPVLEAYKIGKYPLAGIPSETQWNDVLSWAKDKGLLKVDVSYTDSVSGAFLP